jgi:hypothetical protein
MANNNLRAGATSKDKRSAHQRILTTGNRFTHKPRTKLTPRDLNLPIYIEFRVLIAILMKGITNPRRASVRSFRRAKSILIKTDLNRQRSILLPTITLSYNQVKNSFVDLKRKWEIRSIGISLIHTIKKSLICFSNKHWLGTVNFSLFLKAWLT